MNTLQNTQNKKDYNFILLLISDFVSSFGGCFLATAITLFKYKESYSLLTVSIFPLITIISQVISYFINTKWTFRLSFRLLFFINELLALCFAMSLFFFGKTLISIVSIYLLFSVFFALLETYRAEFLKAITPDNKMPFRQSVSQTINLLVVVVGTIIAGIVADALPLENQNLMYLVTACVYPIPAVLMLFVSKELKPSAQENKSNGHESEITEAHQRKTFFTFTEATPIFVGTVAISFVGGATSLLTMSYVFNVINAGALQYSILSSVMAVASAVASMFINVPIIRNNLQRINVVGLFGIGAILFLILLQPSFKVLIPILATSAFISTLSMTYYNIKLFLYYQQSAIRTKFNLLQVFMQIASGTSKPFAGFIEKSLGIIPSFLLCGVLFFVVAPINLFKVKKAQDLG